jgi:TonB family protein
MLTEPTTQLERRIIAMRTTKGRLARVTVYGGTLIAVGVLAFACSLQSDTPLSPKPASPQRVTNNQTFFEFQVEQAVTPRPGNAAPRYPDLLRSANVEGEVLAQFVVDTAGRVDMNTFKILKSSHDLFTAAVRGALPSMQFFAAQVGGRKVKQLVQMPFQFSLSHDDATPSMSPAQARPGFDSAGRPAVRKLPAVQSTITPTGERTYLEFQVNKQASPVPGNPSPRYPDVLRSANVEGEVLAEFIVDATGRADMGSFKVLRSTHELFTKAVESSLPNMQFYPGEVGGKPVRQLIQMPFEFTLAK